MKIGAVGFGSRTAGVYNEFSKINPNFETSLNGKIDWKNFK